ncbi:leucine-rich repeat flightless-interacting 2-like isoform X13 [Solea senegalensis]|uniref:Leucine-rich repeat flightless-interacting 2-like isoform X13 n=1 Tax=Solea senegalensis TaxID=28829 RepID=A0AAV6RA85_SOLSE|nr:leucine-rich repeat flightless-interacting 2-like isoform X13 [Solea senegalensis]
MFASAERYKLSFPEGSRMAGREFVGRGLKAALGGRPGTPPIKRGSLIFQVQKEDSERYSRSSQIHMLSDDDERMSVGSRGSVRVEDRDYLEKGSRAASSLTAATLTSLGGTSSRRGSGETALAVDAETSIREIKEIHELKDQIQDVETKYTQNLKEAKDRLTEMEEKYRKAMVSNAQLDNEKNNLMYQVDTLKDSLMELEELLSESRRQYEEKVKEFDREKHTHGVLQFQFNEMKETLKQSEELLNEIHQLRMKQEGFVREISDLQETVEWKDKKIGALERQKEYSDAIRTERDELREEVVTLKDILKKHGIVLGPDLNINGDNGEAEVDGPPSGDSACQPAQDSQISPTEGNSVLEIRLRKLVDEREKMIEQVKKLKAQLEQKSQKNGSDSNSSPDGEIFENGNDPNIMELQRDSSRQMSDLKFKLVKAEQEVTALEQNVTRLEGQVTRYKTAAENSEKVEDELKADKRKLQRELRSALDKVDELESNNSHLSKRLEKIKSSRGMAQTP